MSDPDKSVLKTEKISIVDFVHAMFKSSVIDICKRGDGYLLGTRARADIPYPDDRQVIYTFNVTGLGTFAQVLERLGKGKAADRPPFKEGDKELIAQGLLDDIKQKHPNWAEFLNDKIEFKPGGKGYVQ